METVIEVKHLTKTYGETVAVNDISFVVARGEIFCIVGPNGAGKTTTVETLMGLRKPDRGAVSVLGLDPQRQRAALAQRVGVQLQEANLPERIKVWEALDMFAAFYGRTIPWEPLLAQWGLAEKRNAFVEKLSGGQKQRLFIALALLNDPEIVFLDEITTGLDPQARRATWDLVRQIRDQGKTVILVTHFMDEAQALADRVAIIDYGRIVALDTPQALIDSLKREHRIVFTTANGFDAQSLIGVNGVVHVSQEGNQVTVSGGDTLLLHLAMALTAQHVMPTDLHVERADLEDVFIAQTGRKIRA
jgi:ABC-2 type transport system ATP-binding protein